MLGLLVMLALLGLVWARLVRSDKPLSRSIGDVGWGMFRRMLEYKCAWYGARLILAPMDFPSTRMCSRCGCIGPRLPLSERIFRCTVCGLEMDRDGHPTRSQRSRGDPDENSSLNLRGYGLAVLNGSTGSSPGSDACRAPHVGTPWRSLWRRNGPPRPVSESWVVEAGSNRTDVVAHLSMSCRTGVRPRPSRPRYFARAKNRGGIPDTCSPALLLPPGYAIITHTGEELRWHAKSRSPSSLWKRS